VSLKIRAVFEVADEMFHASYMAVHLKILRPHHKTGIIGTIETINKKKSNLKLLKLKLLKLKLLKLKLLKLKLLKLKLLKLKLP